jgi:alpha-glucosidase (family GH31 glycosyl hydrolase)
VIQGVRHDPLGFDDLYSVGATERAPRDPMAGQAVAINAMTWPEEVSQSVWLTWTENGVAQPDVGAQWQYNNESSESFWQAQFGPFARGDQIAYTVHANEGGAGEVTTGPFTFHVTDWSTAAQVTGATDNHQSVDFTLTDSAPGLSPKLRICFPAPDCFQVELAPGGQNLAVSGQAVYALGDHGSYYRLTTSALTVQVQKSPYRLSVYEPDGVTPVASEYDPAGFRSVGWASDGHSVITQIEDHYQTAPGEVFYGFGERYDHTDQAGRDVNTWIYNEYGDQGSSGRTYLSIPFFISSRGYGIYVATTALTEFNLETYRADMLGFTATVGGTLGETLQYYFFKGTPKAILDRYTQITGRPQLPPKWAFGLWLSANEWNSQAMVADTLNQAAQNGIPATVLVLEQWADEATFYVWHGAQYQPKPGDATFSYSDFTFPADGEWQDPRQMVHDAGAQGVRVVLWQIPALKEIFNSPTPHYPTQAPPQHVNDKEFAAAQGYVVAGTGGKPYRTPVHSWFGNSMIPDFTKPAAVDWWMSKRAYLVDEVGVAGFKTDGGEMVFGRDTTFGDGRKGVVLHNAYPGTYTGAYNAYLHSHVGAEGGVFSRSGTAGAQTSSFCWAGDQFSTFEAFQEALRAGLSAGASGVPFWGWDIAGFAGAFPTSELYLRASAMATFCPIMQLHSQWIAPPQTDTRMPWNVQAVTGDDRVIPIFRSFANMRMNLLPYIYSEAHRSSLTGTPLMRAMSIELPTDTAVGAQHEQYMFGDQLLVAPVVQEGATVKNVHIPRGEWHDLWYTAPFTGSRTKSYDVPLELIPVYARPGAVIPLNLNSDYELGGAVGNSIGPYGNLTFRIFPSGQSHYDYYDDARDAVVRLQGSELWSSRQVSVMVPQLSSDCTLQVITSQPEAVTVGGAPSVQRTTVADLRSQGSGWFWDPVLQATLVKVPSAEHQAVVTLAGVDKAAYQAEFAVGAGTATDTNHQGYYGIGFVDGFTAEGASVTFGVSVSAAPQTALRFRYAAAGQAATRTVYIDGIKAGSLNLPALADWDTWGEGELRLAVTPGPHQVQISFDPGDTAPINLDSLTLAPVVPAPPAVFTQHNDAARTGANLNESVLTPAGVAEGFGKLFAYPVNGQVFAQPLYVPGVQIPGKGTHNVVFVATMANRVYAFDADDPLQVKVPLWERKLEPPVPLPDPNVGTTLIDSNHHDTGLATKPDGSPVYTDIREQVGILSTPVVSLAHNALFIVTASKDTAASDPSAYTHHLHALDLTAGVDTSGGPQTITASFPGTPYAGRYGETEPSSDGKLNLQSHRQLQRTALLLLGDTVYFAFASYGDKDCFHGWVLAYSASTLEQTAVWCSTPAAIPGPDRRADGKGGIWQAGEGLAGDENAIYVQTGNGGFQAGTDFADCIVKLAPADLSVLDWFSPFNQQMLADHDLDIGSSGAMLIPGTDLIIGGCKESKFYVMRAGNMGHYDPAGGDQQIFQSFYVHAPEDPTNPILSAAKDDGTGHHVHGGPVCWHGPHGLWLYIWVEDDVVKAYEVLPTGKVATVPITLTGIPTARLGVVASQGSTTALGGASGLSPGMPGGMLSISANGTADGIVWATHPLANANEAIVPGIVCAYDATDLSKELWNSKVNAQRDDVGNFAKFSTPMIAGGKVYVATFSSEVVVYGLL